MKSTETLRRAGPLEYLIPNENLNSGTSLVFLWLGLCTFIAGGAGPIPGRGTKIPHATQCGQKKEKKKKI